MTNMTSSQPNKVQPAPGAGGKLDRLRALLREMFQLDRGDLDFGLYRIMNLKAGEIAAFLDEDLLPQVKTKLNLTSEEELAALERDLDDARKTAQKLRIDPDTSPLVQELYKRLAEMRKDDDEQVDAATEADVYNHLTHFFARYYAEGDFISQRRYASGGRAAYLIPYDGEEVKLHWANAEQYYVKTTENYAAYAFTVGAGDAKKRVRFEIAAADNEKDTIAEPAGKQRRFALAGGTRAIAVEEGDLVVRFAHRPLTEREKKQWAGNGIRQQGRINEAIVARILKAMPDWLPLLAAPAPTDANGERTVLAKHVERYTAKNSFDYFIHRDLGGFLRRELDLYLNSEVLNLDDLEQGDILRLDRALARVRAVRFIGGKIIDFLAQLEAFQKQLWLKKKFALETHWCVTLDRVPDALYAEIAANTAQCAEWVALFAAAEIEGDLTNGNTTWTDPPSIAFLKANPSLVLDTRHFDRAFTDRLLAALSDAGPLDDQLDGLLIHGENFQALNLLQARYQGQVQCVHIDPPYNTQTSGFMYKNGYQHSSWLTMMHNRVEAGIALLNEKGHFLCHIDENEYEVLHLLLTDMNIPDGGTVVWDKKNPMLGRKRIATQHEYVLWRTWSESAVFIRPVNIRIILAKAQSLIHKHGGVGEQVRREFNRWIVRQRAFTGGERAYRFIDDNGNVFRGVAMGAPERRTDPKFYEPLIHPVTKKPCPVPPYGWSRTPETLQQLIQNDEIIFGKDETIQPTRKVFLTANSKRQMSSVISDSGRGKSDVDKLGLSFPYCHPVSLYEELVAAAAPETDNLVLDFFAGSGTTGHAVVNLNREDGGRRKYMLVELGHHFDTVLLPRMKKVVYSSNWKDGEPVSRNGVTQVFKYIRLESYEDAMDSLDIAPPSDAQKDLLAGNTALAEDYRLRYMLGVETAGSASLLGKAFANPFAYTLSVVRDGVRSEVHVDLPETFNFLIGLRVASHRRIDGVLAIMGTDAEGRDCLILWRDLDKVDHAALDAWFDRNRDQFAESLDVIYANGDHTLNAMREPGAPWTAETIEPVFRDLMFMGES